MNKSAAALNENQPQVEQEMLWAGFLKVKRCNSQRWNSQASFWHQVVLEPRAGLCSLFRTNIPREEQRGSRQPGVSVYFTVRSSIYLNQRLEPTNWSR